MKIKDGLLLCKVGESNVILAATDSNMQVEGLTTVNETGSFIWEHMLADTQPDAVIDALVREFDVDRATAAADFDTFTASLRAAGFLED